MADKIKRFIECLVPVTACNLKCHYCYVIQYGARKNEMPKFQYSAEHIAQALSQKRLGGICHFNICGAGETLIPAEVVDIAKAILEQGHYINITTNGTLKNRFEEIAKFPKELLERLNFCFSFHYLELKERNLLETFFENIKMIRRAGASICVQFNMCDEYVEHLEEMKKLCLEHVGALPQVALTRDELSKEIKVYSKLSKEDYKKLGDEFDSKLWECTNRNFLKKREEFCYAGDWTFRLNLATGEARRCYCEKDSQNFFENIDKPIIFAPIGCNCKMDYCFNSSHFLSLGNIPDLEIESYSELRNRVCLDGTNWQNDKMREFLSSKLYDSNERVKNESKNNFLVNLRKTEMKLRAKVMKYKNKINGRNKWV